MTLKNEKRIVRKNLDFSTKFNNYMVTHSDTKILASGSFVVFTDPKDSDFSAANVLMAQNLIHEGKRCYIAQLKKGVGWSVNQLGPA